MALVHAVEALEDAALVLRRDADARVGHGDERLAVLFADRHLHAAALDIVLDGVVAEVIDDLVQKPPHAAHPRALALHGDRHVFLPGGSLHIVRRLLRKREQVDRFTRHLVAFVELGEADDIADQRDEALRLLADVADEAGHILLLHHAVFQQLRAADDALQRRFELVRHIRREFAAILLRRLAVGDIEGQQHRADHRLAGGDAAHVELPDAAAALGAGLAVSLRHRVGDSKADIMAAVDGQEVLADAALIGGKKPARGGVDAQHTLLLVKQDEPLAHTVGDLREFHPLPLQLDHLLVDLVVLAVDAPEQRRKFFISVVVQRTLEVQLVERLHDSARDAPCQHRRQDERQNHDDQNGLHHADEQHARRRAADGDAQHAAVRKLARAVHRLLQKGGGIARALALAVFTRLPDLLAVGVIFKALRVGHGVGKHRAVGRDPRQAVAVGRNAGEVVLPAALHRDGGKLQLVAELLFLNAAEIFVQAPQDDEQARQQHRARDQQDRMKDLFGHALPSIR